MLLDFKQAQAGLSGIGQDVRLTLYAFQNSPAVKRIGLLLYPKLLSNGNFKIRHCDDLTEQSKFLYSALDLSSQNASKSFIGLRKSLQLIAKFYRSVIELITSSCAVTHIDDQYFAGMLYRNLFPEHEATIEQTFKKTKVLIGNFSRQNMLISECLLRPLFKKKFRLDTTDYDFFITQYWNTFEISDNTALIIRAYDAVPIIDLDTVTSKPNYFAHLMKRNSDKAYFVCDSLPVEGKLIKLLPQIAGRTFVVPCAVSDFYKKTSNFMHLKSTCVLHWSASSLKQYKQADISAIREKSAAKIRNAESLHYILFVSAIEPRKNLRSLIEAWHPLYTSQGLRLVICGNEGWHSNDILRQMSPLVESGAIIHLEKVPLHDMPLLYSHAQAFVSPSYAEGFGLPVVEAMRCECPIAISNIEEYRWVAGEAALYFDPYNVSDIRAQINALLFNKTSQAVRRKLIQAGLAQSERYTIKAVSKAWQETLEKIAVLRKKADTTPS